MVKTLKLALVVATAILSPYNLIFAEAQELQYAMLPADLRSYVNEVRQRCKELDSASQPHEVMQGIWPLDLDGNGSHDFMVDAQQLCNGWLKGGNCTNRGCDLKIWKKVDQRVWRKIFDEHLYAKFISQSEQHRLQLIAASIYAGDRHCNPALGQQYSSGQSCDVLVRYRKGAWIFEKIR